MNITIIDKNNRKGISTSGIWVAPAANLCGIAETTSIVLGDGFDIYPALFIINARVDRSIP